MQMVRKLLTLSIPLAFVHLANMAMQLVDTIFVGKVSPEALGGVSVGGAVFSTLMVGSIGLLLGLDYLISHAVGAGRREDGNRYLIHGFYLATLVALPCTLLMHQGGLVFRAFEVPPAVAIHAEGYLRLLSWSLWPFLIFTACRQYLQAIGTATAAMWIVLFANVVNALANWVFVFGNWGFDPMGARGSALATLVSRAFMLVAMLAYLVKFDRKEGGSLLRGPIAFSRPVLLSLLQLGAPAALQIVLEVGVFASATLVMGRLGAVPLAAHQIVLQIASFTFMLPLALSSAAAVQVAQAVGANERAHAREIGWLAIFLGGAMMSFFGIVLYLSSGTILRVFSDNAEVLATGARLMLVTALFQIFDGLQVVSAGTLRGIGNTRLSMLANLIGHWCVGLPVGAWLCFKLGLGATGVWMGLSIGLTLVAILLVFFWAKGSRVLLNPSAT